MERQVSDLRQKVLGWAGADSHFAETLKRQNWLFSAQELMQKGQVAKKNKKYENALAFYHRARARSSEFKANIQPHIERIKSKITN